jgi:hypothetical protein
VLVGCTAAIAAAALRSVPGTGLHPCQQQVASLLQLLQQCVGRFSRLQQDVSACEAAATLAGHWLTLAAASPPDSVAAVSMSPKATPAAAGDVVPDAQEVAAGGCEANQSSSTSSTATLSSSSTTGSAAGPCTGLPEAAAAAVAVLQLPGLSQGPAAQLVHVLSRVLQQAALQGDRQALQALQGQLQPLVVSSR